MTVCGVRRMICRGLIAIRFPLSPGFIHFTLQRVWARFQAKARLVVAGGAAISYDSAELAG
jgi:hypothetical protein